jgi:enamine deaminase RidA (YjgF/YER057c/UK114 family)
MEGMPVYEKLRALNISLAPMLPPVAAFVPFVQTGNLLFVSGHIAKKDGKPWAGKLGEDISLHEGVEAARSIAIDLVNTLHAATGDLEKLQRIVKIVVLVNSASHFTQQHLVANGASELLSDVFGEKGAHSRAAFGVSQIPFGACVEVDLIAEFSPSK